MKIIFLDLKDLDDHQNVRHVINAGELSSEPVLPLGLPGSFDAHRGYMMCSGVLRERTGLFRMWYWGMPGPDTEDDLHIGCAESGDGVRWEKPRLGLAKYRGSTDNNIVQIESRFCPGSSEGRFMGIGLAAGERDSILLPLWD